MRKELRSIQSQVGQSPEHGNSVNQAAPALSQPHTAPVAGRQVQQPPSVSEAVKRRLEAQEAKFVAKAIRTVEETRSRLARLDKDCPHCVELSKTFARKTLEQAEAIIADARPRIVRSAKRLIACGQQPLQS